MVLLIWNLATNRTPFTLPVVEETKRLTVTTALPFQPLFDYYWRALQLVDCQVIGDKWVSMLAILDLNGKRSIASPCLKLLAAPALIPCATKSEFETVSQESKDIEYRRFAASVGA
ncbi:hypothetical protein AQ883_28675 [Burkholderia pseudomallei]|nr:hypothetical protein A7U58_17570 [Burkholderia pseudomallei]KGS34748.1 hypothetical protein X945_5969 [Burkholderia pseudomallei ABCPW 107]KGS70830.1 hypothetical protein X979_5758 [Burkholderia pseudomallei MSHR7527]ANW57723.1 hypothetical protein A7U59_17530 [Burkholderia pseudomallei]KKI77499.1 hypothetical protein VU09_00660 [Burkholderia pseudomallei]